VRLRRVRPRRLQGDPGQPREASPDGRLVLQKDVFQALREERGAGRAYDLVLADPPYGTWSELQPRLAEALPATLAPDGLLVVETSARVEPELPLTLVTSRRYGSARITLFSR